MFWSPVAENIIMLARTDILIHLHVSPDIPSSLNKIRISRHWNSTDLSFLNFCCEVWRGYWRPNCLWSIYEHINTIWTHHRATSSGHFGDKSSNFQVFSCWREPGRRKKNQRTPSYPQLHLVQLYTSSVRYRSGQIKSIKHSNIFRGFPPPCIDDTPAPVGTVDRWACPGPGSLRNPIMVEPGADDTWPRHILLLGSPFFFISSFQATVSWNFIQQGTGTTYFQPKT